MVENTFNFEKALEKSIQNIQEPVDNSIIQGRVVSITNTEVFIDIGWTQEIILPLDEFDEEPVIGENVNLFCYKDKYTEEFKFSKRGADRRLIIKELTDLYESYRTQKYNKLKPVKAKVIEYDKNSKSFIVNYKGFLCKVPLFEMDIEKVEENDVENYLNKEFEFYVVRKRRRSFTLSRKKYLRNEIEKKKRIFFKTKKKNDIVEGRVKKILDDNKGVIIDFGGFIGFLPKNEVSFSKYFKIDDIIHEGEKLKLRILNINRKNEKLILSYKAARIDPWKNFKYNVGDQVKGIVRKVFPDGVVVEIEEGIEGFIRKRDFSWVDDPERINQLAKEGEVIEAKILNVDHKNKKLRLSVKHIYPNPWDTIDERYNIGEKIKGKITKVADFGILIEIEKGIEGLLRRKEISWTKNVDPVEEYGNRIGEEIEVVIKNIDKKKRKIALSLKELFDNPWDNLKANIKNGVIEVEIKKVEPKRLIVKASEEIEGIIPINEATLEKAFNLEDKFKSGEKVKTKIKVLDPERKKLILSIKDLIIEEQKKEITRFIYNEDENKITLGDLLGKEK